MTTRSRGALRAAAGAATAIALALAAVGCTEDDQEPTPTSPPSTTAPPKADLSFGVYGPEPEIHAFRSTVEVWNTREDAGQVRLQEWPNHAAMRRAIERGDVPDVFLASRSDLAYLQQQHDIQPVDELLDERGVDFGDGYSRDALDAFSADDRLQCMPYALSPMVIFYNTRLVDFQRMAKRDIEPPEPDSTGWSFEQFAAAADIASKPRRDTKGVHIAPTLSGLAPFIQSGGGSVFDDPTEPTSLSFSSDDTLSALERTLELLRNPQLTLSEDQLSRASPLQWFERGKLGMIAGYRSLVPRLRQVPGLDFDVRAMPVLDSSETVGSVTGLCLSARAASTPVAADFMVHELSAESVGRVTQTGYFVPANLEVAFSDDFLQPDREPEHADAFNDSIRSMNLPPTVDTLPQVEAAVAPELEQLVYGVGVLDLDGITEQIDEKSRAILDPESASESPSPESAED